MSDIRIGDVVQIDPEYDRSFGGCFLVVTEVKAWGVQGYVRIPDAKGAAEAYYRVEFTGLTRIGTAAYTHPDDDLQQIATETAQEILRDPAFREDMKRAARNWRRS